MPGVGAVTAFFAPFVSLRLCATETRKNAKRQRAQRSHSFGFSSFRLRTSFGFRGFGSPPRPLPRERFQILVTCADEADQRRLYERLTREGRACRVLVL